MKKIILFIFYILISIANSEIVNAQTLEFMGIPIHSHISDYQKVLSEHRFKDKYPHGELSHSYWENGDFWKQKNCFVRLFSMDKSYVDIIKVTIPYSNFKSTSNYVDVLSSLISDLKEKYGITEGIQIDMEELKKSGDMFFYDWDHNGDTFYRFKWKLKNGELILQCNAKRAWGIKLQYTTTEFALKRKEANIFKGGGTSDL